MLRQEMQATYLDPLSESPRASCSLKCWKWKSCLFLIEKLLSGYGSKENVFKNQNLFFRYLSVLESEIEIKKKKVISQEICELQKEFASTLKKIQHLVLQKITNGDQTGKYSKLNTFFKKHLPRSFNSSSNPKQFQTITNYIKESKNILPALSRISKKLLSSSPYCQSSSCLNCITEFDQDDEIEPNLNQAIVSLEIIDLDDKDVDRVLTDLISYMMNFSIGCLMIGAKKQNEQILAKGIMLSNQDKHIIYNKLEYIRKECIFPEKISGDKFEITFINVKSDTIPSKSQEQGLFIIRVYFEAKVKNQTYFSIKNRSNSNGALLSDYRLVRGAKYDENYHRGEMIYKKVYSKYINPVKVGPHPKIECKLQTQQQQMCPEIAKPSEKEVIKDPDQYGNRPLKTLDHYQSILVLNNKIEDHEKFLQNFILKESKKGSVRYTEIYEKFREGKESEGRQVFYVEHRRKHSLVSVMAKQVDVEERVLILLNIKNILALIRCEKFDEAYEMLSKTYVPYFQRELIAFKSKEGVGQKVYYFKFENNEQSIFAFTLLEFYNIRSKFVGPNKILDATQTTLDQEKAKTENEVDHYASTVIEGANFDLYPVRENSVT